MPTNNKEANLYKEPTGLPIVSNLQIIPPRKKPSRPNIFNERQNDICEADEESRSGCTTLSTHGSLKRKSTSAYKTCQNLDDKITTNKQTKVNKDDYALLFPGSTSDRAFTVMYLDCSENYGVRPCRK